MKTLSQVHFYPQKNSLNLYYKEQEFSSNLEIPVGSLPAAQQAITQGAMQWAQSRLSSGFTQVNKVIVERTPDIVLPAVGDAPESRSPAFDVSITGVNAEGAEGVFNLTSLPSTMSQAVGGLWDALAQILNP